jgi:signal transduction histidine kinase
MFSNLLNSRLFAFDARLRFRLFLSHSLLAILVLLTATVIFYGVARYALIERAHRQLESVMTLKKLRVEGYLSDLNQYLKRVSKSSQTLDEVKSEIAHAPFHSDIFRYVIFGVRNEVLFDSHPDELDPQQTQPNPTELHNGSLSTDTKCHTGVKLIPCMWVHTEFAAGKLFVKIRLGGIYGFLAAQNGLGETGESYLIGRDSIFRSPSRFLKDDIAFITSVNSHAVKQALNGESGHTMGLDYRNKMVLSAYSPLQGTSWVLLSEIDRDEVLQPLSLMQKIIFISVVFFFFAVLLVARLTSTTMARPLENQIRAFQNDIVNQRLHQRALYEGQEKERNRLAAELHDGLGQQLTALSLHVAATKFDPVAKESLQANLSKIAQELRRISSNMVPLELDKLGLPDALRQLSNELAKTSKIEFHLDVRNFPNTIPTNFCLHLYRIAQEAIQNVIRHSSASDCWIELSTADERVDLRIVDNGTASAARGTGQGIGHMRQRAESLGGSFAIRSDQTGTVVEATIPKKSMEGNFNVGAS